MIQVTEYGTYTMRKFSITNTNAHEKRDVWHYQYSGWPKEQSPSDPAAVIDLIGVLQKSQHVSGGPVIAHDR